MTLTIRNAITFGGLAGAKVVAGCDSLDNVITSISVLEVAESKIAHWVIQGELYITSFYAIRDDVERQKIVIRTLASCGCCGLVICHIDMWIKKIDDTIIDLCNELHFPLIVAKSEKSYVEILNPIIGALIRNKDELQRGDSYSNIRNDFLELMVNEDDVYEVFKKISQKIKHKISYLDIYYECIYSNKGQEQVAEEISYIKANFSRINSQCAKKKYALWQRPEGCQLIYLIKSQRSLFGFIVIECGAGQDIEELLQVAEHLCVACTLLFSRKDTIVGIKERYFQEYVGDLLVWNFRSEEMAITRGRDVGLDIANKNCVIVVNLNSFHQIADQEKNRELANYVKKYILPNTTELVRFYNEHNAVIYRSDTIIILLEDILHSLDLRQMGDSIVEIFKQQNRTTVSVGISDYFTSIKDIPSAYNQAFNAAILGRERFGENQVVTYLDVWFFHKLRCIAEDPTADLMCRRLLEPLVEYDVAHQSNLVDTLRCLFKNNMDVGATAQAMYVHRNTLLHRKNKIIELLGYSPFEMPYLANFIVAFGISG